jgi:hypothetical protein
MAAIAAILVGATVLAIADGDFIGRKRKCNQANVYGAVELPLNIGCWYGGG